MYYSCPDFFARCANFVGDPNYCFGGGSAAVGKTRNGNAIDLRSLAIPAAPRGFFEISNFGFRIWTADPLDHKVGQKVRAEVSGANLARTIPVTFTSFPTS